MGFRKTFMGRIPIHPHFCLFWPSCEEILKSLGILVRIVFVRHFSLSQEWFTKEATLCFTTQQITNDNIIQLNKNLFIVFFNIFIGTVMIADFCYKPQKKTGQKILTKCLFDCRWVLLLFGPIGHMNYAILSNASSSTRYTWVGRLVSRVLS